MRRHNFKNIYIAHIDEISFKYIYFFYSLFQVLVVLTDMFMVYEL